MNTKSLRGDSHRKAIKRSARKLCKVQSQTYNTFRLQKVVDQLVKSLKAAI